MIHNAPSDLNLVIEEKLQLLRDFRLLGRRVKTTERRADDIRKILARCKTEREMERKLYDVLHGNMTLEQLIQKEGY